MDNRDRRTAEKRFQAPVSRPLPASPAREATPSRLLYVSGANLVPTKLGPARRTHHVIDQLCRFYDVSVLSLGTDEHAATFAVAPGRAVTRAVFVPAACPRPARFLYKLWQTAVGACDFLPARAAALHHACAEMAARHAFDAVVLSSVLLRRLPIPDGLPVISDAHNVEFDVLRRTAEAGGNPVRRHYARRQMQITKREERRCAQRVDLILAASERDRDVFRGEFEIEAVDVVANGIDLDEFRPIGGVAASPTIVFTGLLSYYPNQHGIRWFLDRVFPIVRQRLPRVRLVIAGAHPPRWLRRRHDDVHVEVTGGIPDMRPILARAAVVIAPLHIGGGTRVKILEALAMARPVVSTPLGAEGLGLEHERSIVLAGDAGAFAREVVRVLENPDYAARLAASGRREVLRRFDWDRIGDHLERCLAARFGLRSRSAPAMRARGAV